MLLLRSWKESSALFVPKNFKLFLLVTIRSALETYSFLAYYFWWLILLVLIFDTSCYYPECALRGDIWMWSTSILKLLLSFVLFALVRPTVPLKNYMYVMRKGRGAWLGFLMIYGLFFAVRYIVKSLVIDGISIPLGLSVIHRFLYNLCIFLCCDAPLVIVPIMVFSTLFYLDSRGACEDIPFSLWRGSVMFVFNAPFCILSFVFIYLIWTFFTVINSSYGMYLFFSFIPFMVSYFKNMYVKRLHDQFNLYF